MILATVLRSGGDFRAEHVGRLAAMVERHAPGLQMVCLSDQPVPCARIPLRHGWPGWWSKIELFRPGLFLGPVLYLDLDTDIVADPRPLARERFTMLADFYRPERPASGAMAWTGAPPTEIYERFCADPDRHMRECRHRDRWGDQGFIAAQITPDRFGPPEIVSYKAHCRSGVPEDARVVCYHGKPRPWETA